LSHKNFILTGSILLLVLANSGCGIAWVIVSIQIKTYEDLLKISPLTISINALSATADVIIAATLVIMLNRSRTGFSKSDTMINKLILFVVNTGLLTSCCAIASLISLVASPRTLIYASFYFCIGRLYSNSLLATLNARRILRGRVDDVDVMMLTIPSTSTSSSRPNKNISIRVNTTHDYKDDVELREDETINNRDSGGIPTFVDPK